MRRPLLPLLPLAALTLTGCFDLEIEPIFTCNHPLFPSDACVDEAHPVDFYDRDEVLAVGGELDVPVLILEGTAVSFETDRPELLELVRVDEGGPVVRGRGEGSARVIARGADGVALTARWIDVASIASFDFHFDGAADPAALTELAALPGAIERVRLVARSRGGLPLVGTEAITTVVADGAVSAAAVADGEPRGRSIDPFGAPRPGFLAAFRADALGTGTLTAEVDGVASGALPITVVPAATTVALTVSAPSTPVGWGQFAGLSGEDDRGVPVAGLVGDFAVTPSTLASIDDPHAGEVLIRALAAGEVTVTATLPDRTVTTTFVITGP